MLPGLRAEQIPHASPGPSHRPLPGRPPQVEPYLPYEYTCEGMLERIQAYIQHQVGGPPLPARPKAIRAGQGAVWDTRTLQVGAAQVPDLGLLAFLQSPWGRLGAGWGCWRSR